MNSVIFFRNDDVRSIVDNSLTELNNLFLELKIPVSHAVEPANISTESAEYLKNLKIDQPELVDIIQHGYNHKTNFDYRKFGKRIRGEFGGLNTDEEEFDKLSKGKFIMDKMFPGIWTPVITFPFGSYNSNSIIAADRLGYAGMSSAVSFDKKSVLKNRSGHILHLNNILGRNVAYHLRFRPSTDIFEIDTSLNIIKKYNPDDSVTHYTIREILSKYEFVSRKTQVIGILLHHRYHGNQLDMLADLIKILKTKNVSFSNLRSILNDKK